MWYLASSKDLGGPKIGYGITHTSTKIGLITKAACQVKYNTKSLLYPKHLFGIITVKDNYIKTPRFIFSRRPKRLTCA